MSDLWVRCTSEHYYEMLGVLPPASMGNSGSFQVGEPMSHANGFPTFASFCEHKGNFYESTRALTFREFKKEFPSAEYYYCG